MTVIIQLSAVGINITLFDIYSNIDYGTPIVTGISKMQLLEGYSLLNVPDNATTIRLSSTGNCSTYTDIAIGGLITTTTTSTTAIPTTTTTTTLNCSFIVNAQEITTTSTTSTTAAPTTTTTTTGLIPIAGIYLASSSEATCLNNNTGPYSNRAYVAVNSQWFLLNGNGKYVVKNVTSLPDTLLYDYNAPGTIIDANSLFSQSNTIDGSTLGTFMIGSDSSSGGSKILLECDGIGNAITNRCYN